MSKLLVQTPLAHSVDVSLAVTHVAPNPSPAASGVAVTSPLVQAHRINEHARRSRCMS